MSFINLNENRMYNNALVTLRSLRDILSQRKNFAGVGIESNLFSEGGCDDAT
jgi:hypothetical protein